MSTPAASEGIAIPESYWDSLHGIYSEEEWKKEEPGLRRILPLVAKEIAPQYELDVALARGGAGIVSRITDLHLTNLQQDPSRKVYRALKLARPIEDKEQLLNALLTKEFKALASLTHTNVVKLYYAGALLDGQATRAFYIMDYLENPLTPYEFLKPSETRSTDLIRILKDIVAGLQFLFAKNFAHNDVKPSNVLVGSGRAVISDLGSATSLLHPEDHTTIMFTERYAHPDKLREAVLSSDPNRMRRSLLTKEIRISWDLYSLGLTILELLDVFAEAHPDDITPYEYRYIRLLGSRALDGFAAERFRPYAFPRAFYEETKYRNIEELVTDLGKLTGEFRLELVVPELDFFSGESIQVAMHGQTPTTKKLLKVIAHPAVKRLSSISQLGLIVYLYPGATHSRGEHSLGAYGNAARMVYALWNDPVNPLFRQVMRERDLVACLLATLLHDLGQYPLSHDMEEASNKFFDHEEVGYRFFDEQIEGQRSLSSLINQLWPTDRPDDLMSDRIRAILKAKIDSVTLPVRDRILHSIIDGPIDADKLDYLLRDSKKLNVPYGLMIDFERLSKVLTIIHEAREDHLWAALGVHEKGKVSAESVAFARYALFGAVYWHRTSRAVKAMLHRATWEMLALLSDTQRQALKQEFVELILHNRLPDAQQELFATNKRMKQALWPGINLADLQLLAWLWQKCGEKGKHLIESLAQRDLYKRALVVSREKNKDIWKRAQKFAEGASPSERLGLETKFQVRLLDYLRSPDNEKRETTRSFEEHVLRSVYEVLETFPLALIDIPGDRTAGMQDLRFFGEMDRWRYSTDDLVKIRVEESVVWSSIVESFGESLGKIRIFVHPNAVETVRAIQPAQLENMLLNSLLEV